MPERKASREARRAVTEKFRIFIAVLLSQFTKRPEELLQEIEAKAMSRRAEDRPNT
jgi:hypothetical protein